VAGLNFSLGLADGPVTKTLVKLCNIPAANTSTLIPLPNLPSFPGGNFNYAPGSVGYFIGITLAAGSTFIAPAADVWQTGNFPGAPGMSNFAASPVNSFFDIAFVQHEPGPLCTTLIDKPFTQNYDECLRYYNKSWNYPTAVGTAAQTSFATFIAPTIATAAPFTVYGGVRFSKPMAKAPNCVAYNPNNGNINAALLFYASSGTIANTNTSLPVSSIPATSTGISALNMSTGTSTAPMTALAEWTADTGW
jgi:hypothetical protein